MTEHGITPSTGVGEEKREDAQAADRIDTDPEQEANAPNREHQQEFVRSDLKDDPASAAPSDNDELDQPDDRIE
jgi:hypothetical protein